MAARILRSVSRYSGLPRILSPLQCRLKSDKGHDVPLKMPTPWETAVGAERFEMAMREKGIDDPYEMKGATRKSKSTAQDPNIVPSIYEKRMVGCVCQEDVTSINWMVVHKGETKRCECGHWFKLVEYKFPDLAEYDLGGKSAAKSSHGH